MAFSKLVRSPFTLVVGVVVLLSLVETTDAKVGYRAFQDILVLTCGSHNRPPALHLAPKHNMLHTAVSVDIIKRAYLWLSGQIVKDVQCHCPAMTEEDAMRHFGFYLVNIFAALDKSYPRARKLEWFTGCGWEGSLGQGPDHLNITLPGSCSVANWTAGLPCQFEWRPDGMPANTKFQIALQQCSANPGDLPYISISCSGTLCGDLMRPCETDADCESSTPGVCGALDLGDDFESEVYNAWQGLNWLDDRTKNLTCFNVTGSTADYAGKVGSMMMRKIFAYLGAAVGVDYNPFSLGPLSVCEKNLTMAAISGIINLSESIGEDDEDEEVHTFRQTLRDGLRYVTWPSASDPEANPRARAAAILRSITERVAESAVGNGPSLWQRFTDWTGWTSPQRTSETLGYRLSAVASHYSNSLLETARSYLVMRAQADDDGSDGFNGEIYEADDKMIYWNHLFPWDGTLDSGEEVASTARVQGRSLPRVGAYKVGKSALANLTNILAIDCDGGITLSPDTKSTLKIRVPRIQSAWNMVMQQIGLPLADCRQNSSNPNYYTEHQSLYNFYFNPVALEFWLSQVALDRFGVPSPPPMKYHGNITRDLSEIVALLPNNTGLYLPPMCTLEYYMRTGHCELRFSNQQLQFFVSSNPTKKPYYNITLVVHINRCYDSPSSPPRIDVGCVGGDCRLFLEPYSMPAFYCSQDSDCQANTDVTGAAATCMLWENTAGDSFTAPGAMFWSSEVKVSGSMEVNGVASASVSEVTVEAQPGLQSCKRCIHYNVTLAALYERRDFEDMWANAFRESLCHAQFDRYSNTHCSSCANCQRAPLTYPCNMDDDWWQAQFRWTEPFHQYGGSGIACVESFPRMLDFGEHPQPGWITDGWLSYLVNLRGFELRQEYCRPFNCSQQYGQGVIQASGKCCNCTDGVSWPSGLPIGGRAFTGENCQSRYCDRASITTCALDAVPIGIVTPGQPFNGCGCAVPCTRGTNPTNNATTCSGHGEPVRHSEPVCKCVCDPGWGGNRCSFSLTTLLEESQRQIEADLERERMRMAQQPVHARPYHHMSQDEFNQFQFQRQRSGVVAARLEAEAEAEHSVRLRSRARRADTSPDALARLVMFETTYSGLLGRVVAPLWMDAVCDMSQYVGFCPAENRFGYDCYKPCESAEYGNAAFTAGINAVLNNNFVEPPSSMSAPGSRIGVCSPLVLNINKNLNLSLNDLFVNRSNTFEITGLASDHYPCLAPFTYHTNDSESFTHACECLPGYVDDNEDLDCIPAPCLTPPTGASGGVYADAATVCTNALHGTVCPLSCPAYYTNTSSDPVCSYGQWVGAPECIRPICAALSGPLDVGVLPGSCSSPTLAGDLCQLACTAGYSSSNTPDVRCLSATGAVGVLNATALTAFSCQPIPCVVPSPPASPAGMTFSPPTATVIAPGTSVSLNCPQGYSVQGVPAVCSLGGITITQTCNVVTCPALGGADYANVDVSQCTAKPTGQSCMVRCLPGRHMVVANGSSLLGVGGMTVACTALCADTSQYRHSPFLCLGDMCPVPTKANGTYGSCCRAVNHDEKCRLNCLPGYQASVSEVLTCTNGVYVASPSLAACLPVPCPPAYQGILSIRSNCTLLPLGSTCLADCATGYERTDNFFRVIPWATCRGVTEGVSSWAFPVPGITCSPKPCTIPVIAHGSINCSNSVPSGTWCTLACQTGFHLVGGATTQCYLGQFTPSNCEADVPSSSSAPFSSSSSHMPISSSSAHGSNAILIKCGERLMDHLDLFQASSIHAVQASPVLLKCYNPDTPGSACTYRAVWGGGGSRANSDVSARFTLDSDFCTAVRHFANDWDGEVLAYVTMDELVDMPNKQSVYEPHNNNGVQTFPWTELYPMYFELLCNLPGCATQPSVQAFREVQAHRVQPAPTPASFFYSWAERPRHKAAQPVGNGPSAAQLSEWSNKAVYGKEVVRAKVSGGGEPLTAAVDTTPPALRLHQASFNPLQPEVVSDNLIAPEHMAFVELSEREARARGGAPSQRFRLRQRERR